MPDVMSQVFLFPIYEASAEDFWNTADVLWNTANFDWDG